MKTKKIPLFLLTALIVIPVFATTTLTNSPAALSPGPYDGRIAYWTAQLLDQYHYLQEPLDKAISEKFFDGYIAGMTGIDPAHENFLQSDIADFSHWRTNLDTLTVTASGGANLTPAFAIWQRYLERIRERTDYMEKLLKRDDFTFTGDDHILLDRRHAPFPKNLEEAKQIWREQLRYDFLSEKLSSEIAQTNGTASSLSKSNLTDITDTLARRYELGLRAATNADSTDILQVYLEGLMHAYDPHSDYMNNAHAQDFSIEMNLSFFGIGATLQEVDGYCRIEGLVPGGPAEKSKQIKEGDRIIAVAQGNKPPVDVVDMELRKVVQLIRGPKGTQVRLTISPVEDRSARRVVILTRDEIKLEDQEAKAKLIEFPDAKNGANRIGVIDVPSFYAPIDLSDKSTPKYISVDVAKLIKKLEQENVSGIILDMRGNPGGSLEEAIRFTGLFIKSGPVVLVRNPDNHILVDSDNDSSELYAGPLIVLVNRASASAAEITTAALQDYGRAIIVGDSSTFGKGTVQSVFPLQPFIEADTNDPGEAKITIRKFYRVSGASTQLKGVASDIVLPDLLDFSTEIGEASLDNPLPWDTVNPVDYDKLNLVEPYLAALKKNSAGRVATNQDFIYIAQDIERFKKLQADKTASLNEREDLKELQTNRAIQKDRAAEIAARKVPDVNIYDITVENADLPGLPAPEPLTTTNDFATTDGVTLNANSGFSNSFKTNSTATSNTKGEVKTLPPDPTLVETENILKDYISLMKKNGMLIANH